jgi:hypothetical protein
VRAARFGRRAYPLGGWRARPGTGQLLNEHVRAIVATNAFGMGIDKPNVRLCRPAIPGTLEAYYQEVDAPTRFSSLNA